MPKLDNPPRDGLDKLKTRVFKDQTLATLLGADFLTPRQSKRLMLALVKKLPKNLLTDVMKEYKTMVDNIKPGEESPTPEVKQSRAKLREGAFIAMDKATEHRFERMAFIGNAKITSKMALFILQDISEHQVVVARKLLANAPHCTIEKAIVLAKGEPVPAKQRVRTARGIDPGPGAVQGILVSPRLGKEATIKKTLPPMSEDSGSETQGISGQQKCDSDEDDEMRTSCGPDVDLTRAYRRMMREALHARAEYDPDYNSPSVSPRSMTTEEIAREDALQRDMQIFLQASPPSTPSSRQGSAFSEPGREF